ncbi:hypothetical protein [Bartonella henselae]|uniref:hypothetical protein n=1 Tax=Bartonella henselae TaxID=38323 RepID=UPI000B04ED8A|nr:hypothetical protein [Bartonella henselae]
MNIKFFFVVCTIFSCLSSFVKATDRIVLQEEIPVIITYNFSKKDLFFGEQVNPLLNKVILPTHPGNHTVFWKNVAFFFRK